MALSNMSRNLAGTFKTRPPLVVFLICLMGIMVTTSCLAYYIHSYNNPMFNYDAKDDWISLLKHFNEYDVCIEKANSGRRFENINKDNPVNLASTTTLARLSQIQLDQNHEINVEGIVSLEGWFSKCEDREETPAHLLIAFVLPKRELNATNENVDVCVTLTGPENFIPKLDEHSLCTPPPKKENIQKYGKLSTKLSNVDKQGFCAGGSIGKLEYDIEFSENQTWNLLLTSEDCRIITNHLIAISSLLLIICILLTCYAMISPNSTNNGGGDGKQSLTSKGIYL